MQSARWLLVLCILGGVRYGGNAYTPYNFGDTEENWAARLYKDTLTNYSKASRPVRDHKHNTTVHLGLALNQINLDDHDQTLSLNAWAIMTWCDEYLRWNPKEYANIERMHYDERDIWVPDIKIFNTDEGADVHPFGEVPILVDSDGRTYWIPPTHIRVRCDLDLTQWPSDQHECVIRMGSWTYHGEEIDIQLLKENETDVILTNYEENNRWELVKAEAKREETKMEESDSYFEINFLFTVKRRAKSHATYVTQSTLALVVIVLASYGLPLSLSYTRIVMHLIPLAVLIGCYFILFSTLPANGGPVPLVVRYFSGTIILVTISLLSTIFLTTRACCFSNSASASSRKIVGMISATPGLRNVVSGNYNQLDSERGEDLQEFRSDSIETVPRADESPSGMTSDTVRRVINFILFGLFAVAFCVDYSVLRSVT